MPAPFQQGLVQPKVYEPHNVVCFLPDSRAELYIGCRNFANEISCTRYQD